MDVIDLIRGRDLPGLKEHLKKADRALDVKTEEGVWAIHEAIRLGNLEMVKFIMEYAIINPNLRDDEGNQALHYGVSSGNLELVRYLTERVGMSVTYGNLKGETPLDWAVRLGEREIQEYLEGRLGWKYNWMYHNPIRRGAFPDPSIVRVGEDYYMVNSTFMFFPCIPVSHSKDLIHWEIIGYAITRADWARLDEIEGGCGYWAPDISYYEGRFYITATYRAEKRGEAQRLQMVTSSDQPQGPYCEPVFLEEDGIDPSIFTDVDGRRYMLLNRGARIFEISRDGREILSKPRLLWYGDTKKASEGPHLLYRDGYYYLFMAEGGTGWNHRINVARSKELMGVYEPSPYNPILRQWDGEALIQYAGHGKPVETPEGDWYMVYLCARIPDGSHGVLGRETALDPMTWTGDGWPVVNRLRGPSSIQVRPCVSGEGSRDVEIPGHAERIWEEKDNFPVPGNWGQWCMPRGREIPFFGADEHGFWMEGDGLDLNSLEHRTTLLKRQREFRFVMEACVEVGSLSEGEDKGLTCYYDESSYLKLGVACRSGSLGILAAEFVDDRYVSSIFLPASMEESVELRIETEFLKRTCLWRSEGEEKWNRAAVFEDTGYLSSEGLKKGKRFTGAMEGLYVHGTGRMDVRQFVLKGGIGCAE